MPPYGTVHTYKKIASLSEFGSYNQYICVFTTERQYIYLYLQLGTGGVCMWCVICRVAEIPEGEVLLPRRRAGFPIPIKKKTPMSEFGSWSQYICVFTTGRQYIYLYLQLGTCM